MSKHTPGPWRVKTGHACYHAVSDDGMLHTGCISFDGNGLANARLIAAAPELLEIVLMVQSDVERGECCPCCMMRPHSAGCLVTETLARIDGEPDAR